VGRDIRMFLNFWQQCKVVVMVGLSVRTEAYQTDPFICTF